MSLYVRSHSFPGDNYSSYWGTYNGGQWIGLDGATVYTQKEIDSFRVIERDGRRLGFITNGVTGFDDYVPVEGEWTMLPEGIRMVSKKTGRKS